VPLDASPDFPSLLSPLDAAVFAAVLVLTFAAVAWGNRRRREGADSFLDHLLMGRTLTLPLFTATLAATWYGGIFGVTEIAFKHGIYNFITQGVFWYLTYIIFALVLVDRIAAFRAITLPELVGRMFGPRAATLAAVFNFFNVVPIVYAISMGLLLQLFIGWPLTWCVALATLTVCLYSLWGGFRAVVYSDLVQFGVMCAAVALVVVYCWSGLGGWDYLRANLPASHFEPTGGQSAGTLLVWGFIALSTLVDPNFYQRCFAAESPRTAKRGILIATAVWCAFDLCTTLGGMYARAAIPGAEPGQAYLVLAAQVLPSGLRGFFLAGVAATVLSTLDSYLFVASHTVSYDLLPQRLRRSVSAARLSMLGVGILAVLMSAMFEGSIKAVWKTLGSYSAGCMLLPMMLGYWRPKLIAEKAFLMGALFGAAGITCWRFAPHAGFWAQVDDLYAGLACNIVGLALGYLWERRERLRSKA